MSAKLPQLKNGKKQVSELDSSPVLLEKERRIRDLEAEIKKCDTVISKYQKEELKRQKKKNKGISSSAEKDLVERVFYTEVQKRSDKLETLREQLTAKPTGNVLSQDEVEDAIGRLYHEALSKKAEFEEKRKAEHAQSTSPTRTVRPDEVTEIANRLCNNEVQQRQQKMDVLCKKHIAMSPKRAVMSKDRQSEANERLYTKPVAHHAKVIESLRSQYVPTPQQNKLSKEKQAEVAARLCVTK